MTCSLRVQLVLRFDGAWLCRVSSLSLVLPLLSPPFPLPLLLFHLSSSVRRLEEFVEASALFVDEGVAAVVVLVSCEELLDELASLTVLSEDVV